MSKANSNETSNAASLENSVEKPDPKKEEETKSGNTKNATENQLLEEDSQDDELVKKFKYKYIEAPEFDEDREDIQLRVMERQKIDLSTQMEADFKVLYRNDIKGGLLGLMEDGKKQI